MQALAYAPVQNGECVYVGGGWRGRRGWRERGGGGGEGGGGERVEGGRGEAFLNSEKFFLLLSDHITTLFPG